MTDENLKEFIIDSLHNKENIRKIAEEFYNSELNYNNADKTNGQTIYRTVEDVEEDINAILNDLRKVEIS